MSRVVPQEDTRFLTVPAVASELRLSDRTVKRLIHRDSLPALWVGRSLRIDRAQLDEWLDSAGRDSGE